MRVETERLERERVEREVAQRVWEDQERAQREWDENEVSPVELDEEDEVLSSKTIAIDSDSSDVPSGSRTGATSRVFVSGAMISVLPKPLPKKGLKRKQKDQLAPSVKRNSSSVKKSKHVTSSESESGSENEVITAPPRKNKEAKNAATKELGDEKRT